MTDQFPSRRRFVGQAAGAAAAIALGLMAAPPAVRAQAGWPTRAVRIISPYGAGGANDISARLLAEGLSHRLGQQFVVDNKPGAGTRLANEQVARAAPDGSTFLFAAAPYATAESLYSKLSYDPRKDLKAISLAVVAPIFLIVRADSPFQTAADLVAYGKNRPEGLTFGSPGSGSGPHLAAELFFRVAGVKGLNVHHRGDATAYTELLGGRLDATLTAITAALPHIQAGKLRVLGVASEQPTPIYPSAPTLISQGYPDVVGYGWFGMMAPAGTAQPIIDRMATEIRSILGEAAVKEKMVGLGLETRGSSPAEFDAFIARETARWAEVIRDAGIKGE